MEVSTEVVGRATSVHGVLWLADRMAVLKYGLSFYFKLKVHTRPPPSPAVWDVGLGCPPPPEVWDVRLGCPPRNGSSCLGVINTQVGMLSCHKQQLARDKDEHMQRQ